MVSNICFVLFVFLTGVGTSTVGMAIYAGIEGALATRRQARDNRIKDLAREVYIGTDTHKLMVNGGHAALKDLAAKKSKEFEKAQKKKKDKVFERR